jgi:hypothetical protein
MTMDLFIVKDEAIKAKAAYMAKVGRDKRRQSRDMHPREKERMMELQRRKEVNKKNLY